VGEVLFSYGFLTQLLEKSKTWIYFPPSGLLLMTFWKLIIISLIVIALITIFNIVGRNLIILLLAIELIFFAGTITCVTYYYTHLGSHWNLDILFAAIALTVLAAAESAVGLAIIARLHKQTRSIKIKKFF
jgi:NADH:ubiquinone oxidoreductase subunit K